MYLSLTGQWTISVKSFETGCSRQIIVANSGVLNSNGTHAVVNNLAFAVNPPKGQICIIHIQDNAISKKMQDSKIALRFPTPVNSGCQFEIGTLDAADPDQSDYDDLILTGYGANNGFISFTDHFNGTSQLHID
jgi:hypothetical protein